MHYRNGRAAKNGDTIIKIGTKYVTNDKGESVQTPIIEAVGVLHNAVPGNDHCNGSIAPISTSVAGACMCDCLHIDDVTALLKEKGLDKRPPGK